MLTLTYWIRIPWSNNATKRMLHIESLKAVLEVNYLPSEINALTIKDINEESHSEHFDFGNVRCKRKV